MPLGGVRTDASADPGPIRIDPGFVTGGSWLLRNLRVFVPATRPVEVASIREATLSLNRASVSGAAAESADVIRGHEKRDGSAARPALVKDTAQRERYRVIRRSITLLSVPRPRARRRANPHH